MSTTYARVEGGVVLEVIAPFLDAEGTEVPISERFTAVVIETLVAVPAGEAVAEGWTYSGTAFAAPVAATPTAAQTIATYETALQEALDAFAQSWGYDSIVSAASYAASTVQKFKDEANALIGWRDAVWTWAATEEAAIEGGTATLPATPAAFVTLMPAQPARPTA